MASFMRACATNLQAYCPVVNACNDTPFSCFQECLMFFSFFDFENSFRIPLKFEFFSKHFVESNIRFEFSKTYSKLEIWRRIRTLFKTFKTCTTIIFWEELVETYILENSKSHSFRDVLQVLRASYQHLRKKSARSPHDSR